MRPRPHPRLRLLMFICVMCAWCMRFAYDYVSMRDLYLYVYVKSLIRVNSASVICTCAFDQTTNIYSKLYNEQSPTTCAQVWMNVYVSTLRHP